MHRCHPHLDACIGVMSVLVNSYLSVYFYNHFFGVQMPCCCLHRPQWTFPNKTTWVQWQQQGQDVHSRFDDPLFVQQPTPASSRGFSNGGAHGGVIGGSDEGETGGLSSDRLQQGNSWQLQPGSPALKLGFQQIDTTKIGCGTSNPYCPQK